MLEQSESALVAAARDGDRDAFGELVRRYQERVYMTALQMTHNHTEADQLSQDAFIKAFQSISTFESRSGFFTWMYRITVNLCLTHLRTRGRNVPLPEESDSDEPGRPELGVTENLTKGMEENQDQSDVWKALDGLGPELRAAAVLVYLQDMSPRDAAKSLGCAEATVHWRLFKARKQLKKALS